ncbi:MAG: FHA domain-containing protein, partial [Actinomycetota bacterium]|nr:FHA domain-containing protein [Actinomycetota bacterium]
AASRAAAVDAGQLEISDPPERAGQRFDLGSELTVGRAPGCGVSLPEDTFVSQLHARVFRRDGELFVEDLGSTNGTFVNDNKVSAPVALRDGDRLKTGRTTMVLAR